MAQESTMRLHLSGIRKEYPGCLANDDIELLVNAGETHALLGENGAGKSTLMKIIYGVIKPDAGKITWQGEAIQMNGPAHACQLGIGMVFQHFSLFETLTVAENIALSLPAEESRNMEALSQRIRKISTHYGMALDPDRQVHTLSVGAQQRVEIIRCLLQDIKLLILDEPTSVLTPQEVRELFRTLKTLTAEGCSILFISHKLDEVTELCNATTVLRNGRVTGRCNPQEVSSEDLARMMVGEDTPLNQNYQKAKGGDTALRLNNLSFTPEDPFGVTLNNLNLKVKAGEILGITGVAGAYLSLVYTPMWSGGMSAGRGWIALSLVVFASWKAERILLRAYLFGFTSILHLVLQGTRFEVQPNIMAMLPYVATIIVLVWLSSDAIETKMSAPKSIGQPYRPLA